MLQTLPEIGYLNGSLPSVAPYDLLGPLELLFVVGERDEVLERGHGAFGHELDARERVETRQGRWALGFGFVRHGDLVELRL